ncbi:MAG: hypothetical protein ACI9T9_000606, partial [Oleiphilaceae bacterium]
FNFLLSSSATNDWLILTLQRLANTILTGSINYLTIRCINTKKMAHW